MCQVWQTIMEYIGANATTIIAIVSVAIALIALIYSIKESKANRENTRLAVLPHLSFEWKFNYGPHTNDTGLWLISDGVGPAIISKVKIFIDNKIVCVKNRSELAEKILSTLNVDIQKAMFRDIDIGSMLRPDYNEAILLYKFDNEVNYEESKVINDEIKRISILINYKSLYGEEFEEELDYKNDMIER